MSLNIQKALNTAWRTAQDMTVANRLNDEANIAKLLQGVTGCTLKVALTAARTALNNCDGVMAGATLPVVMGRHGPCIEIRCTTDPRFSETWSDHVQGRERCDELNRGNDFPAYFIA